MILLCWWLERRRHRIRVQGLAAGQRILRIGEYERMTGQEFQNSLRQNPRHGYLELKQLEG